MTTPFDAYGVATELPTGWEAKAMRRAPEPIHAGVSAPLGRNAETEQANPVLHLANFALPVDRGDYGSGAVDVMGRNHALIVLVEFGPECVGTALFAPRGLPAQLDHRAFDPNALQRRLPGQLGMQRFFTESERAFCLYVVLGGRRQAPMLCDQCSGVIKTMRIKHR